MSLSFPHGPVPPLLIGLERMIQRNPSYDARSLLQGVPDMLRALVTQVRVSVARVARAVRVCPG